jgi:hypothetical protein
MGRVWDTQITGCYASGNVKGGSKIGGLVGCNEKNVSIMNCYAIGNVTSKDNYVGGLVGRNNGSNISNCYAIGKVNIENPYYGGNWVGGLVGIDGYGIIKNCVAANDSVTAFGSYTNRVAGSYFKTSMNNYANNAMTVTVGFIPVPIIDGSPAAGIGKVISEFQSKSFYTSSANWTEGEIWDFTTIWKICEGETFPLLRWQEINCGNEVYNITATAGANGIIAPSGEIEIEEGHNQAFLFTANSGYEIAQVLIDGINNSTAVSNGEYIFQNVMANHTILVMFSEKVGIVKTQAAQIKIYPNPTRGEIRIENEKLRINNMDIFDIYGKKLLSYTLQNTHETTISTAHLSAGIYFVKIGTEAGVIVRKIVKE